MKWQPTGVYPKGRLIERKEIEEYKSGYLRSKGLVKLKFVKFKSV